MPAKVLLADIRLRLPFPVAIPRVPRLVPSRRSFLVGAGVVAVAVGSYVIARETPVFAIQRVEVTGGSKAIDAQVARALAPLVGRSLVGLNGAGVLQRADALSTVVSASYDRAFPHTLRVRVVAERPIAVLRDAGAGWVVSARGRVIRSIAAHDAPTLPRMWIAGRVVRVGETLPRKFGGTLARTLATAGPFRSRIVTASLADGVLVFHLRSGIELVVGAPTDIPLKTAVAERMLQQVPWGTRTVDVSVPSRTVASPVSLSSLG